jgi:hypothetical protein
MPRGRNQISTEPLKLSTSDEVARQLDLLLHTGLFGKTRAEVAELLLRERLREIILEGWSERQPAQRGRKRR